MVQVDVKDHDPCDPVLQVSCWYKHNENSRNHHGRVPFTVCSRHCDIVDEAESRWCVLAKCDHAERSSVPILPLPLRSGALVGGSQQRP